MALRAVPDHPKFMAFKSMLRLPKGAALGWLESVWHFAGRFTPRGNIGKYSDIQIEAWVEWDGAPGGLIVALTDCGWLDKSDEFRLIVHDWHQCADVLVHTELARRCTSFANGTLPNSGRLNQAERERFKAFSATRQPEVSHESAESPTKSALAPKPVPAPVPEPVPGPVPPAALPDEFTPSMLAQAVLQECLLSGRELLLAIEGQAIGLSKKSGYNATKVRDLLIARWQLYESQKGELKLTWSAKAFFGDGHWRSPDAWPRKDENYGASKDNSGSNGTRGAAVGRVERGQSAFRAAALASVEASGGFDAGPDDGGIPEPGTPPGHSADVPARCGDASGGVRDPASADGSGIFPDAPEILPPSQRNTGGSGSHGSQRAH